MATDSPEDKQPSLPPSLSAEIDAICDQFEQAWMAGEGPSIEEYLEQVPEAERGRLFRELLLAELELRRKAGEQPTEEEYLQRFPEYETQIAEAFGKGQPAGEIEPTMPLSSNAYKETSPPDTAAHEFGTKVHYFGDFSPNARRWLTSEVLDCL